MLNPEIKKHIWLDITKTKIILIPITALLIYLITKPLQSFHASVSMATFYYIGIFFIYIWGLHNASSAILTEYNQRTWEYVKQSTVSPWSFTWGKLLGSTLIGWYGAFVFFCFYLIYSNISGVLLPILLLIMGGVFAHSLGMLLSVISLPEHGSTTSSFWYFLFILIISSWIVGGALSTRYLNQDIAWYRLSFSAFNFSFMSLLLFTGFSVLGLYRSIQAAFQYTIKPWAWTLFHLALIIYFSGFSPSFLLDFATETKVTTELKKIISHSTYYMALATSIFLSYLVLLTKTIDKIAYYRFFSSKHLFSIPLWLISLFFTFIAFLICIMMNLTVDNTHQDLSWYNTGKINLFTAFIVLLLVRDIALHHFLVFKKNEHQRAANTIFYLFLLYILIPWAARAIHLDVIANLLVPNYDNLTIGLLSLLAQVFTLGLFINQRWKNLWKPHNE